MYRRTVLASIGTAALTSSLAGCTGIANPSPPGTITLEQISVENEAPSERRVSIDVVYDASVEHTIVETIPAGETLSITDEWPNATGPFVVLCHSDTDNNYHLTTLDTREARKSNSDIVGYEIMFKISETGDVSGDVRSLIAD